MKQLLTADSIRKRYHERQILTDVWLELKTGEVLGLLGRNGSGKSTLLRILCGLDEADQQFIRIDGKPMTSSAQLMRYICYLPQDDFIPSQITVKKVLSLSLTPDAVAERAADSLIAGILSQKVGNLSGGERRYVAVKIVLHNQAPFVLLDEPFNGLSPIMAEKISRLISSHANKKGIILTDHAYRYVLEISNRIMLMRSGRLQHLESPEELSTEGYLP